MLLLVFSMCLKQGGRQLTGGSRVTAAHQEVIVQGVERAEYSHAEGVSDDYRRGALIIRIQ